MEQTLCYHCFRELSPGDQICGHCGRSTAEERDKYPHALPYGTVLGGRYIIGHVLGQGGFGITYIAQDYRTKELVAIKEFFPDTMVTRNATHSAVPYSQRHREDFEYGKATFLEEAKTLSQFNGHPNIVGVKSYFEENGTAYFAMEYVEGVNLQSYVNSHGGKLTWQEAENILLPVMDALGAVHAKGIIHRDIKPDNLCINSDGRLKLLDFGSARYSMGEKSRSLDVVLTPGFAPKEQYSRHGRQGAYTDVYALAATMYYAITGRKPPDSIDRTDEDELIPPTTLGVRITNEQEDALLKGLAVSPIDRFQTMEAFRAAITAGSSHTVKPPVSDSFTTRKPEIKTETKTETGTETKQETTQEKNPSFDFSKLPKWLLPAAGAFLVLVIVLVAALGGGNDREQNDPVTIDSPTGEVSVSTPEEPQNPGEKTVSLMTKSTHYNEDGSIEKYTESEYNEYGEELRWNTYLPDGTLDYYWEFAYDDSGNMLREWHSGTDIQYEYAYDSQGNKLVSLSSDAEGRMISRDEYSYADQGRMTKCTTYDDLGALDYWEEYTYDADGNQIKMTHYKDDGAVDYWKEYSYDAKGNQIEESKYDSDDGSRKNRTLKSYDEWGNIILFEYYNGSSELSFTARYDYEYDDNGNKLKLTYYKDDVLQIVSEYAVTVVKVHGEESSAPVVDPASDPTVEAAPTASQAPIPVGEVTITLPGETPQLPDGETETVSLRTKATYYNDDGSVDYYSEYQYNEYGEQTLWECYEPDGTLKYYYEYILDDYGNEIKEVDHDPDGTIDSWYDRVYDDRGNVLSSHYYDGDGTEKWWFEYTYDDQGNQIKMVAYDPGAIVDYWTERVYDGNGNEIEYIKYNGDGSVDTRIKRVYDGNGNEIKYTVYNEDGSIDHWDESTYDGNGNELLSISYNANGTEEDRWIYTYDGYGNRVTSEKYEGGSSTPSYTSEYEYGYDINGNMLKETYYYKDKLDTVTEYTVTEVLVRNKY